MKKWKKKKNIGGGGLEEEEEEEVKSTRTLKDIKDGILLIANMFKIFEMEKNS